MDCTVLSWIYGTIKDDLQQQVMLKEPTARAAWLVTLGKYALTDHVLSDDAHPTRSTWQQMDCTVLSWIYGTIKDDLQQQQPYFASPQVPYLQPHGATGAPLALAMGVCPLRRRRSSRLPGLLWLADLGIKAH